MNIYRKLQNLMFPSGMLARTLMVMLCIAVAAGPVYALDLYGTYIRLGINSDGSLVNDAVTLGATFPDSPSIEFFIPGTPYEGWAIGVDGSQYLANFAPAESSQIPVTVIDTSAGSTKSALVTGTANFGGGLSLAIKRTIAFSVDGTSVTFGIELTNTGTTTLTNVAFLEGGDPDQGYALTGEYNTHNDIVFNGRFVRAWASGGAFPSGLTVGLGTCDLRCVLSVESPWQKNPYEVLNSPVDPNDSLNDAEICIAFDFGTLGVGQTVSAEYHIIFGRTVSEADAKYENICPPDNLIVTPHEGFFSSGDVGGPFTPSYKSYTLTNTGPNSLDWTATKTQPWLDATPASGTLGPNDIDTVTVSLNANANTLPGGHYIDTVTFTNLTSGVNQVRSVDLFVGTTGNKMYWTDSGTGKIQRANLDGSNIEDLVTTGLSGPWGIALDISGGKMYWTDNGTNRIQRANLDGSNIENLVTTGLSYPWGIALDIFGGKMYWADYGTDKIQRANLDGSHVENLITTGLSSPYGIAVDPIGGKMYWTDGGIGKIRRANLDGSSVEDLVTTGLSYPYYIALELVGSKMYWTDYGTHKIQRANLDGSNIEDLITTGLQGPLGITLDTSGGKMYWADYTTNKIQRANLDGSNIEDLVATGLVDPAAIAIPQIISIDDLNIEPFEGFTSSGPVGGPFTPSYKTYTLTNTGPNSLDWTATKTQPWLDVTPGGTLASGASTTVDVCINAHANTLPQGRYTDTVTFSNLTSGVSQTRSVMLLVGRVASMPFVEGFEGGPALNPYWEITGTNEYRTQVTMSYEPHGGSYHLTMDDTIDGSQYSRNELTLTINLDNYENVLLTFWAKQFNDEPDGPPPIPFIGGYDFDGVAISEDGYYWYEVQGLRNLSLTYMELTVDLDAAITAYGLTYNSTFKIRFNQYDNYSIPTDGIAIDDIEITGRLKDNLSIAPDTGLVSSGYEGGPFTPSSMSYTLTNVGPNSLNWTAESSVSWVDIGPNSGALLPAESNVVEVSLNADANSLAPGSYNAAVTFTNLTSGIEQTLAVSLTVNEIPPPPPPPSNPNPANGAVMVPIDTLLSWNNRVAKATVRQDVEPGVRTGLESYSVKEMRMPKRTFIDAIGQGGPDPCGYTFLDSDESGGPSFNWIEISGTGTNLNLSDDDYFFPINLPFNFNFYDTDYTQVAVGSNGTVYFENQYLGYTNVCIPGTNDYGVQRFIAVYWDDLYPSGANNVYYEIVGSAPNRILVVQWQHVLLYGSSSDAVTVQAQLFENGDILLLYTYPSSEAGGSATVGIQNNPNIGLEYLCDQASLHSDLAILFTRSSRATYDVYFDTVSPPVTLIHSGLTARSCEPVPYPLVYETTYYWQVVATNEARQTPGPVWSFTTQGPPGEIAVTDSIPPVNDLNMPFGEVFIPVSRREYVTITNIDPNHRLLVSDISFGGEYFEDFNDGLAQDWHEDIDQSWQVIAGEYRAQTTASDFMMAHYEAKQWEDLSVQVACRRDGDIGTSAAVTLRVSSDFDDGVGSGYVFQIVTGAEYSIWKQVSGSWSWLQSWTYSSAINPGTNVLTASAEGNQLKFFINETLVWSGTDNDLTSGHIGLGGYSEPIYDTTHYFDDVLVTEPITTTQTISDEQKWYNEHPYENSKPKVAPKDWKPLEYSGKGKISEKILPLKPRKLSASAFRLENVPVLPVMIPPSSSITFDVVFEPLEIGDYESTVVIISNDVDEPNVAVQLSGSAIPDYLVVMPEGDFEFSGHPGGPFLPSNAVYRLTNNGPITISWAVEPNVPWLYIYPENGNIKPGESTTVIVSPNAQANAMPQGRHTGQLTFTNITTTTDHKRTVILNVHTDPKIWITPPYFSITIPHGWSQTETLTIGNGGDADLHFSLSSRETSFHLPAVKTTVTEIETDEDKIVLEYEFNEPAVYKDNKYDGVRIEGLQQYERVGAPIIPVRPVKILVPFGREVLTTQIIPLETYDLSGSYRLPPAQKPYPLNYQGAMQLTEPNMAIYGQAKPWPGINYEQVSTQSKRGYQVLTANLFPLQYVPTTGKISYTSKLRLEIKLADSISANIVKPSTRMTSALRTMVDNPDVLRTYPAKENSVQRLGGPAALPSGGPYQYVIITSGALEAAPSPWNFQALRDAKIAGGMTATIVTTEWIYANYNGTRPSGGTDNQTKIRNFLIDAYQTWGTEYVLLGGNANIIPARMFWVNSLVGDTDEMPVDMYYGCVEPQECTFDYDADGQYGEPTDGVGGGDVDLLAEIYVGRAAIENATELGNFIKKTLTYNSTKSEYLSRIAMVGEWLGFGGVSEYATDSKEQIRTGGLFDGYYTCGFEDHNQPQFIDFNTVGCLPEDPTCCWPLYDAPGYDWPNNRLTCLMNGGVHVFNHLGHANETYCMKLYTSDLASLTNTDYFFVYSQGCYPGAFDTPNCFAEVITSMEHGAFAVIMNARYGYGEYNSTDGPGNRYDRQFWDAVLGEGMLEVGHANQDSKEDNLWDINGGCIRWSYYELNLFGDPAQKFRFAETCDWIEFEPRTGTVSPGQAVDVNVTFSGEQPCGTYHGEIIVNSDDPYTPQITIPVTMTIEPPDYFTELFTHEYPFDPNDPNRNDMAYKMLTFTPDGSDSYYHPCTSEATAFPVNPNGGIILHLKDDDYVPIGLGGEQINFYGTNYVTFYVSSNGYITFVSGDTSYLESFEKHFELPRISALFDDLTPSAGGTVSYKLLGDRFAVTFENVPEYSLSNSNSFQIEIFFDGMIRLTWLRIDAGDGLVGLSEGLGIPPYFEESDLSGYCLVADLDSDCDTDFADYALLASYWQFAGCKVQNDWCFGADINKDGCTDFQDLAQFTEHWLDGTIPANR